MTFVLAEKLHMTVAELLLGEKLPISAYEIDIWPVFLETKAKLEKQASDKAQREAKSKNRR